MCGIAGYFSKGSSTHIGANLRSMLDALAPRGPDSAGVAIWGESSSSLKLQLKLGEPQDQSTEEINANAFLVESVAQQFGLQSFVVNGAYARMEIENCESIEELTTALENAAAGVEVVSCGHALEIVKQVGSPALLDETFAISAMRGTHGLGHTRLSTESRIDLSHSQPFWAHGVCDLATVHNGHITNYHKMRRIYESRGVHFYTENDSEIIGIYMRDRLTQGDSFEEALNRCFHDFDGSYCFLAATKNQFAYVKDGFAFKPLMVAEDDKCVAIATEEIALRRILNNDCDAYEPPARSLEIWNVSAPFVTA